MRHAMFHNGTILTRTSDRPFPSDTKPVVVIDPEDSEAVERLLATYHGWKWARERSEASISDMQAALREYANPTPPKPDEPMGKWAVVVDSNGDEWVRTTAVTGIGGQWLRDERLTAGEWTYYRDIKAVRVLSEGVTA